MSCTDEAPFTEIPYVSSSFTFEVGGGAPTTPAGPLAFPATSRKQTTEIDLAGASPPRWTFNSAPDICLMYFASSSAPSCSAGDGSCDVQMTKSLLPSCTIITSAAE